MRVKYKDARNVRFSCAYLFRILINGKYFLVMDEQRRGTYQPVGGVYKYTDDSFFKSTHAVQCMRLGNNSDLDSDLRIIVPRDYASRFYRWYKKETGRETADNLYREFKEEILDRIPFIDRSVFDTIEYRYCGYHIDEGRIDDTTLQLRIADVVELIPTPQQTKAFQALMEHDDTTYRFATKEEIYALGRIGENRVQTISNHSYKVLLEEEKNLKWHRRKGKFYKCQCPVLEEADNKDSWVNIEKADLTQPFTFISYNSLHGKNVWDFCHNNTPPLKNLWIDRKLVSDNWLENVKSALKNPECKNAILFINKEYLTRSTACYKEAELIVDCNIPHIIVLVNIDQEAVKEILKDWIFCDGANKDKLRIFKKIFNYDDDTGHINCSFFSINSPNVNNMMQAYENML